MSKENKGVNWLEKIKGCLKDEVAKMYDAKTPILLINKFGMKCFDLLEGYETMYNGKKYKFLWKITDLGQEGIYINSYVLASSANAKKDQIPVGRYFKKYVKNRDLEILIKSNDLKIISSEDVTDEIFENILNKK